jgi:hypothetical protein
VDGESTVERDCSGYTVSHGIMDQRAPLHCLKRDIPERVHAQVKREVEKHDEPTDEAKSPDRHLVAQDRTTILGSNKRSLHFGPERDVTSWSSAGIQCMPPLVPLQPKMRWSHPLAASSG